MSGRGENHSGIISYHYGRNYSATGGSNTEIGEGSGEILKQRRSSVSDRGREF